MTRAIARQDEALEDLVRSTRQLIRKHSTYLTHTNNNDDYSFHRRRSHANHKPRLQPLAPPQCSHHCCENITKPIPPKTHHHHHVQPQLPPQQPSYQPSHQQPLYQPPHQQLLHQPSYHQPLSTKSRTKTWLDKIIPSKLQCETDDQVGLHDLKKKIYKQKPKPQQQQHLPSVKTTGRPMIIPSVSSSPEKMVVIDVPADTTVILRSIDAGDPNSKQIAAMYHITDMNVISQLFGHVQMTESKSMGDIKVYADPGVKKMSKSHTIQLNSIRTSHIPFNSGPNTPSSTSSTATVVNSQGRSHRQQLQKKAKGMTQYMSMPTQLSLKAQEFHYMDSDASTVDYRGEHSPSSISSTASSLYYRHNDDNRSMKYERVAAANQARGWMR
ncbi:hypothetical protein MAM1_0310d09524 [Mucor ambiguus]|uniref:Uncharacterized protein n=1 Tax=Mucor ambiguus TaxID=91626 RepID=A0A0C9MGW0_9FUNG|nr:hypothetical protein MAM1_0310d09524 [Mucor ambiguus]